MYDVIINGKLVASCTTLEAAQAAHRLLDDAPRIEFDFPRLPPLPPLPFIPTWPPPGSPDWW